MCPVIHSDIAGEVPAARQGLVRSGFIAWVLIVTGYCWNFVVITIMFATGDKSVSLWLMSGIVMLAGVPLSYLTWYRSLYKAAITDGPVRWFWYLMNMLLNIVWCVWMVVGIEPKIGGYSAGVFTMIEQFSAGGGARLHHNPHRALHGSRSWNL